MKRSVAQVETSAIDVTDLRAFCRVADLGSITAAARALGETKGSVSRRLTRLERALGTELLRRSPRLVQTTEDGALYRVRIGRALELLEEANAEVQHRRAVPAGHLRVTAPFDLGVNVFAAPIARFVERYPTITLELVLTEALLDFDGHQIDVALRASGPVLQDSSLIAYKLDEVKGGLFAAPEYLAKMGTPKRPEDLAQHRLLLAGTHRGSSTLVMQRKGDEKATRLRVQAAISASDYAFGKEAAVAGGGIALLPCVIARRGIERGALTPVLGEYLMLQGAVHLVHPGTRLLPPKVRAFRDFMLEAFDVKKPHGER